MGNDNILIVLVLAVIAYVVMTGTKAKAAVSSVVTSACPRGASYTRGIAKLWQPCDPGYEGTFDFEGRCTCQTPTSIPEAAHSPQTPAPQPWRAPMVAIPELCPYDPSLLIGDRRCQMPTGDFTTGYGVFEGGLFTPEQYFK